jgi:hypothetical protein
MESVVDTRKRIYWSILLISYKFRRQASYLYGIINGGGGPSNIKDQNWKGFSLTFITYENANTFVMI